MEAAERKRTKIALTAALILMGAALLLSVCVGKYPISVREIIDVLAGREVKALTRDVFFTLRLPRTLMALLAGLALGMAGSVYQTIFKNPLAAPDIIGMASGANLGAACAIVLAGSAAMTVALGAFGGGILAVLFVMLLVRVTNSRSTATYVLAGIVISAVAQALIMTLKFFADPEKELAAIEFWSMGSFGGVTLEKFLTVLPVVLFAMAGLCLLRRQVALLALDEDESRMLGLRIVPVRAAVLALSTLMVAAVISVTGLITFIGLIAPHIARLILRRNSFTATVLAAIIGGTVLLYADCLARVLYSAELPISILTTLVGVPFLVYFMCNRKRGRI